MGIEGGEPNAAENQPPVQSETRLVISNEVKQLADMFAATPFDPDLASMRAKMGTLRRKPLAQDHIPGLLAEAHVTSILEKFASENPEIVKLNPILNLDTTDHYRFERAEDRGTFTARKWDETSGAKIERVAEYDQVIVVNGLPVVIEVKSGRGLIRAPQQEALDSRFAPLKEHFGTNQFGFILAGTQEAARDSEERRKNFEEKGMILTPLQISVSDLQEHARVFHMGQ